MAGHYLSTVNSTEIYCNNETQEMDMSLVLKPHLNGTHPCYYNGHGLVRKGYISQRSTSVQVQLTMT